MTLKLWERLRIDIDKEDLWSIFNLETSLIPLMLDMRTKGVRVDIDAADRAKIMLNKKTKALRAHLKRTTGVWT
jgi:DNA polymerase I-like protein with 3'-5' exonuclease and polymerase domains